MYTENEYYDERIDDFWVDDEWEDYEPPIRRSKSDPGKMRVNNAQAKHNYGYEKRQGIRK